VVLPKLVERRDQSHRIAVAPGSTGMRILFIGDIVGKPGREVLRKGLKPLTEHFGVEFVIANAENSAAGFGITKGHRRRHPRLGVEVMTSGNHIWDKKEVLDYIPNEPRLAATGELPCRCAGPGSYVAQTGDGRAVGVINAMGPCVHADYRRPVPDRAARD
jgi:calcineurin-like phosphoesterase